MLSAKPPQSGNGEGMMPMTCCDPLAAECPLVLTADDCREDLCRAVERQMVVKFRHDDMGEQPCSGAAAGDRVVWRRCRDHYVAGPARQFLANVPDDFEPARHVIEGLGHLVADLAQRAAATGTGARC